jgi:protein tyrosine/serine phosphatase
MKGSLDTINLLSIRATGTQRVPILFWHLTVGLLALSLPFSLEAREIQAIGTKQEQKQDGQTTPSSQPGSVAGSKAHSAKGDLPNFHVVHDYLLRGGEPSIAGIKALHDLGVGTVVDLRARSERTFEEKSEVEKLGMRYINLPMSSAAPTNEQVSKFSEAVSRAQKIEENQRTDADTAEIPALVKYPGATFVHCAHGSDRTGCMVGIWRVTHDGWSYPKAYEEMRRYYFGPQYKNLADAVRTRAKN